MIPYLGLALLNTFIGLENVSRNAQQYNKQQIANAKIDRILALLERNDDYKMALHAYIEKLDTEIRALVEKESMTATSNGERDLFFLFENRKHAMKWLEDKESQQGTGTAHAVTMKNPY